MKILLLPFAQARESLGYAERMVEGEPDETARALLGRVAPDLALATLRVAVNGVYRGWDEQLGEAREIALIPPVSGG